MTSVQVICWSHASRVEKYFEVYYLAMNLCILRFYLKNFFAPFRSVSMVHSSEEMILTFEQDSLLFLIPQSTDFLRVLMLPDLGTPACDHVILSKFSSA